MEMVMPMNYVEMTDEEMMYVEGGYGYTGIAIGVQAFEYALGIAITALAGAAAVQYLGTAALFGAIMTVLQFGGASTYVWKAAALAVGYGIGKICSTISRALDSSGNGWIGIYTSANGIYTQ